MPISEDVKIRGRHKAARIPVAASVSFPRAVVFGLTIWLLLVWAGSVRGAEPRISARKWDAREVQARPGGPALVARELRREGEYNRRWRAVHELVGARHVSRLSNERLAAAGLGSALLAGGPRRDLSKALQADVLRVLVVRVGFEANRDSQLTTISPGGDFMLDPLSDPAPLEIDPPPHNKAYFEAHLAGLSEYYNFMSGGRLRIEGTVLPEGETDSYKLSDVADYGPGAGNFWTLDSLEALVRDMVDVVDQGLVADGGNGLADYDDETPFTYVIFVHAGSDWQSDINGDSPNDIPTFFVALGEPVELIGTNPQGHAGLLSECSIIPETTNQDGFPGSIAAAFYHEFGHALGLPDVYSTATGLPSVGIWDLMDSGTNLPATLGTEVVDNGDTNIVVISATGVLPPSLSVWCKWYLGWVEMGEISSPPAASGDYVLPAVGVPRAQYTRYRSAGLGDFDTAYPQAYRAGNSPREYYLLENRWVPFGLDETPYVDLRLERDESTQVIQYLAGLYKGTWENSGLYDFFMPAGGLLVWHVNADRIASGLPDNTINIHDDGLRLVEADGIQDIGVLDAFVLGWFGSWRDPFGGIDPDGFPTGYEDLYTDQPPSSRNFDRSFSGVRLSGIGPETGSSLATVKFKATLDPVLPGFPWELAPLDSLEAAAGGGSAGPRTIDPQSLTPVTVAGEQVLILADGPAADWTGGPFATALYGLRRDGLPAWPATPGLPVGAIARLDAPLAGPPLGLPVAGGASDLYWATTDGLAGATSLGVGGGPTPQWTATVADSLVRGPVPVRWAGSEMRLLYASASDSLFLLDSTGAAVGDPLPLAGLTKTGSVARIALLPRDAAGGADAVAVVSAAGWYLVSQDAAGLAADPVFVPWATVPAGTRLWTAVVPLGADANRVRVFGPEGEVGAWDVAADGAISAPEPLPDLDGPVVCEPAVADVDGDGRHDLVLCSGTRVYGFNAAGLPLRGFPVRFADVYPLPDSTRLAGPLIVADATGDGVNEIFVNSDGGHLVGLSATGRLLDGLPLRWGDWADAALAVGGFGADRVCWLASSGGATTGYLDRIAVNGRVTGYGMIASPAGGERTSEWLGTAGGAARRGPAGTVRNLGVAAPVSREQDQVYLYPNPLGGDEVTVRFYAGPAGAAQVAIYNLEGELVTRRKAAAVPNSINEIMVPLPGVASGMYLARVEFEGVGGREVRTLTLAVEK